MHSWVSEVPICCTYCFASSFYVIACSFVWMKDPLIFDTSHNSLDACPFFFLPYEHHNVHTAHFERTLLQRVPPTELRLSQYCDRNIFDLICPNTLSIDRIRFPSKVSHPHLPVFFSYPQCQNIHPRSSFR